MTDTPTILVADDDLAIRTVMGRALGRAGYEVRSTGNASTLWQWVSDGQGDLVITDVMMPDENGLDMIPRIKKIRPGLRIIVISAHSTLTTAVQATERGAFDYIPKPFDIDDLVDVVRRALADDKGKSFSPEESPQTGDDLPLIGRSPAMQDIYRTLARLVGTDLTAIITGESGTGKELIARALHEMGRRRHKPFVAINMAAIPKDLIENELFGHERGAYTGAVGDAPGCFERAWGGTLFLDEIGDMPMDAQTRLLRVLQEGEFTRVGGQKPIKADARIIAATHRDLKQLIRQGLFREDLYYRLAVVPLRIPPLRERLSDISDLVNHFLGKVAAEGLPYKTVTTGAIRRLSEYQWPGNVRELENLIRRLAVLSTDDVIDEDAVQAELSEVPSNEPGGFMTRDRGLAETVEVCLRSYFQEHGDGLPAAGLYQRVIQEVERPLISLTLEATSGNQLKTANILGLNRNTLRKKIRELNIPVIRRPRMEGEV